MNPLQQLAVIEYYGVEGMKERPIEPTIQEVDPITTRPSEPTTTEEPTITSVENIEERPTTTTGDTTTTTTTTGDKGTTIHIYGAGTTTTTYADEVGVNPVTGVIKTSTGGGGGLFPSGSGSSSVPLKKTIFPLAVIAAGIGVLLLKPFK